MAEVSKGSVNTLPGGITLPPKNQMCDKEGHETTIAYKRVQGETDSFGCEYSDLCQACFEAHQEKLKKEGTLKGTCEWCGVSDVEIKKRRDSDEGMSGRIYDVCVSCITARNQDLQDEIDNYHDDISYEE